MKGLVSAALCAAAVTFAAPAGAQEQDYPSREIRLVCGFPLQAAARTSFTVTSLKS